MAVQLVQALEFCRKDDACQLALRELALKPTDRYLRHTLFLVVLQKCAKAGRLFLHQLCLMHL